jgi:imidazole glycerol-phosphate synthase subunit HisF
MISTRIIPVLLNKSRALYKSIKFKNPTYIGDSLNAVKIFNEKEVDELIYLDISASAKESEPDFAHIYEIATECFMPLTYGGGINSLEFAKRIFDLGVEKIVLNTHATNYKLIEEISRIYGTQSLVISIDYKINRFTKKIVPYCRSGKLKVNISIKEYIKNVIKSGAGELIIQSIDRDGTYVGYDLKTFNYIKSFTAVPLVICGGAGNINDFFIAKNEGASGVAAGSLFVFYGTHRAVLINYPSNHQITEGII